MLHRKKETEGNTEFNLQSPRRSQRQRQDSQGSAEFNLQSPRRTPRQSQETKGSTEFSLVSPQRSQKNMQSPSRLSYSSPRTKNEHAHPPRLPPQSGERRSSFKAAMKTLVSPVKKASDMLSGSFRNLNSPTVYDEKEEEDGKAEELKRVNADSTLILLCRELELLSD